VTRWLWLKPVALVRLSAILALVGIGLMVWSLLDPRPIPIMVAMSVGQGVGTMSLLLYVAVVIAEAFRAAKKLAPPQDDTAEEEGAE
jgi:hypothetical protein